MDHSSTVRPSVATPAAAAVARHLRCKASAIPLVEVVANIMVVPVANSCFIVTAVGAVSPRRRGLMCCPSRARGILPPPAATAVASPTIVFSVVTVDVSSWAVIVPSAPPPCVVCILRFGSPVSAATVSTIAICSPGRGTSFRSVVLLVVTFWFLLRMMRDILL